MRLPRWISLILLVLLVRGVGASILTVPAQYSTIQAALQATSSGDTVHVAPGIYYEHLVTPFTSVTLLSDYAWTRDSLDIERTIIDGSWSGTVLAVNCRQQHRFVMEGFTLQRGMGLQYERTGGVQFREQVNAILRHVVLKEHRSSSRLYQVMQWIDGEENRGSLVLDNLRIELDTLQVVMDPEPSQIVLVGLRSLVVHRLRVIQTANPGSLMSVNADTVIVSDCILDRHQFSTVPAGKFIMAHGNEFVSVDSVTIQNSTFSTSPLTFTGETTGTILVNGLQMEGVHVVWPDSRLNNSTSMVGITGGRVLVTNWTHRNCSTNAGFVVGGLHGAEGIVQNLLAEDLLSGGPVSPEANCEDGCAGGAMYVTGLSMDNVTIRRLTLDVFDTSPGPHATISPPVIFASNGDRFTADTLIYRNVEVHDVVVIDPDDYSQPETDCTASLGRAFRFYPSPIARPWTIFMDSCRFVENRQPNTQPERRQQDSFPGGTRMVGSTVKIEGDPDSKLILRKVTLLHNDDGGLEIVRFRNLNMEDVVLVDNSRMGVYLSSSDSIHVDNLYISRTNSYLAFLSYPYDYDYPSWQCVAMIDGHIGTFLNNVSFVDNHTEFMFWCPREDFDLRTYFTNSIFSNNTYGFLVNPEYDSSLFPPPLFDYCFLPTAQPGVGNLVGVDASFDPIQGAPFLAWNSPCVDAGNPNSNYNDAEDPAAPSFPLWPALGSLRNDMGFTGGPHAVALDTTWVSVPGWQPNIQPKDFSLGAPWPNPFNPVTRIPFTLTRPEIVKLSVHNLLGQEVAVLVNGVQFAGRQEVTWNAGQLASGTYLITLEAAGRRETRSVTLLR